MENRLSESTVFDISKDKFKIEFHKPLLVPETDKKILNEIYLTIPNLFKKGTKYRYTDFGDIEKVIHYKNSIDKYRSSDFTFDVAKVENILNERKKLISDFSSNYTKEPLISGEIDEEEEVIACAMIDLSPEFESIPKLESTLTSISYGNLDKVREEGYTYIERASVSSGYKGKSVKEILNKHTIVDYFYSDNGKSSRISSLVNFNYDLNGNLIKENIEKYNLTSKSTNNYTNSYEYDAFNKLVQFKISSI